MPPGGREARSAPLPPPAAGNPTTSPREPAGEGARASLGAYEGEARPFCGKNAAALPGLSREVRGGRAESTSVRAGSQEPALSPDVPDYRCCCLYLQHEIPPQRLLPPAPPAPRPPAVTPLGSLRPQCQGCLSSFSATMGNGMNKILPGLYIGNFKDARDAEQLSRNKVTHILSVHDSARPMLEGVKYLCIPAADSPSQNLTRHFKESIKFIHECRLRGEGCLVHCLAGVSRSVTLVIAYIMTVTDFGWEDALHTVRAGRSCANPNLGFQRQLQEFEKHEVHQYRQWLKEEYGESPLRDAEEARNILGKYKEHGHTEAPPGAWRGSSFQALPLSYSNYTTET